MTRMTELGCYRKQGQTDLLIDVYWDEFCPRGRAELISLDMPAANSKLIFGLNLSLGLWLALWLRLGLGLKSDVMTLYSNCANYPVELPPVHGSSQ